MLRLLSAVPVPRRNPLSLLFSGLLNPHGHTHNTNLVRIKVLVLPKLAKQLWFLPGLMWVLGRGLQRLSSSRLIQSPALEQKWLKCPSIHRCLPRDCCAAFRS